MKTLQINNYTSVLFDGGIPKQIIWNISRGFYEGKINMFNFEHLRQDAEKALKDCGFVPTIKRPLPMKNAANKLVSEISLTETVSKHRIIFIE